MRYFRCENGYVGVTDQCPRRMKGVVYIGRGPLPGQGVESVKEQAYAVNQLDRLEEIAADDVPDDWFAAIGYEKRQPQDAPQNTNEDTTYLTIELPGDRLRKKMLAKPGTPEYIQWQAEKWEFWIVLAISFAVAWFLTFHVWKL